MDVWVFGLFLLHLCLLWGLRLFTTFKGVLESLPSLWSNVCVLAQNTQRRAQHSIRRSTKSWKKITKTIVSRSVFFLEVTFLSIFLLDFNRTCGNSPKNTFSERRFWAAGASQIPYRQHLNNGLKNERVFLVFERTFWGTVLVFEGFQKCIFWTKKTTRRFFLFSASFFSALLYPQSRFLRKVRKICF